MARTITLNPGDDLLLQTEVNPSHPLRRYTDTLAAAFELGFKPHLILKHDFMESGAFTIVNRTHPARSAINLPYKRLETCPSASIAFVLAHEMAHLTPECFNEKSLHKTEFLADAYAMLLFPPTVMEQSFRDVLRLRHPATRLQTILRSKTHPSMGQRIHHARNGTFLDECRAGIAQRRQQRLHANTELSR